MLLESAFLYFEIIGINKTNPKRKLNCNTTNSAEQRFTRQIC